MILTLCSMGEIISVLGVTIVDTYMWLITEKEMQDTLEAKYAVSNVGCELFVMEQFYDYIVVDDPFVIEQAHEIQTWAKEQRILVVCCWISLWRDPLLLSDRTSALLISLPL